METNVIFGGVEKPNFTRENMPFFLSKFVFDEFGSFLRRCLFNRLLAKTLPATDATEKNKFSDSFLKTAYSSGKV